MKTKFYWVALLASAAFIGQAQGGAHGEEAKWKEASCRSAVVSWRRSALDQLEAEAVSGAVASIQQPRRSVAAQILRSGSARRRSWLRHTALLFIWSASVYIGGLSMIMDELADP